MSLLRSAAFAIAVVAGILAVAWPYLPFASVGDGGCPLVSRWSADIAVHPLKSNIELTKATPLPAGLRQRRQRLAVAARASRHIAA